MNAESVLKEIESIQTKAAKLQERRTAELGKLEAERTVAAESLRPYQIARQAVEQATVRLANAKLIREQRKVAEDNYRKHFREAVCTERQSPEFLVFLEQIEPVVPKAEQALRMVDAVIVELEGELVQAQDRVAKFDTEQAA